MNHNQSRVVDTALMNEKALSEEVSPENLVRIGPERKQKPLNEIQQEIIELKKQRNAVVLVHNYQIESIQQIADYRGDSLGLAYKAAETDAEVILFCGVHFMAETAKIVNPTKTVILPDLEAGCSLSDSCPPDKLRQYREENPDVYVVAYINCSAQVKALSDVICTSGNAVEIVKKIPEDRKILFVPDQNLGQWVIEKTGREMELWPGSCYVHVLFTLRTLRKLKDWYPQAPIVAHPECIAAIRYMADHVCSTEGMVRFAKEHPSQEIIVVTESGMLHRLHDEVPDKIFIAGPTEECVCNECKYMKMNTLENTRNALLNLNPKIEMAEDIRQAAYKPLKRMLDWSRQ